jgi:hypothetical protein
VQCYLWLNESQSCTAVQRQFRTMYRRNAPQRETIVGGFKRFIEMGGVARTGNVARPSIADDVVERV